MSRKKIVVFSGAGMSADSGLKTFRDSGGLWENYNVYDVATPEAFAKDPKMVLEFYNMRRKQALQAEPNEGHLLIAELEKDFNVSVVTQNVDNLHERAGSTHVLHLHGELDKVRSEINPEYIISMNGDPIQMGDTCPDGGQLRPHVVWFGEDVPEYGNAVDLIREADFLIVIGTSLQVYPAAGLIHAVKPNCIGFYVDPKAEYIQEASHIKPIKAKAGEGMEIVRKQLSNL